MASLEDDSQLGLESLRAGRCELVRITTARFSVAGADDIFSFILFLLLPLTFPSFIILRIFFYIEFLPSSITRTRHRNMKVRFISQK